MIVGVADYERGESESADLPTVFSGRSAVGAESEFIQFECWVCVEVVSVCSSDGSWMEPVFDASNSAATECVL